MSDKKISLTGIKPTGVVHIGNYFGAIKPALKLSQEYKSRYFIADYHALNQIKDPQVLKEYTRGVAASWLACGLNPDEVLFYRQSDVVQTFELATMLMCFTPKGLMNRAHAYKAIIADNEKNSRDLDSNVNMGLFTYPILMAADILLFNANIIPVGQDQVQHIEIAADIAQAINRNYKEQLLTIPEAKVGKSTMTIPGLDGRKMSKSYGNTIPLLQPAKKLRKQLMKIKTNSLPIEAPKDPDNCNVFALYKLFSTKDEQDSLATQYRAGSMGWGDAKQQLFEKVDAHVAPMREKYDQLMQNPDEIDKILEEGAKKAREIASQTINRLRIAMGFTLS